jgi:ATP-dependent Clp protease ATP-binding subunit ClpC
MTSNIGATKLQRESDLGFQAVRNDEFQNLDKLHEANSEKVLEELKKSMLPELLNRIDKIVVFRALTKRDINKIIDLQIDELTKRLTKQGVGLSLTSAGRQYLLDHGYDAHNGVRPLRRLIQDTIEDQVSMELLNGHYTKGDIVKIGSQRGKLSYQLVAE